jgi:hypothetical protein
MLKKLGFVKQVIVLHLDMANNGPMITYASFLCIVSMENSGFGNFLVNPDDNTNALLIGTQYCFLYWFYATDGNFLNPLGNKWILNFDQIASAKHLSNKHMDGFELMPLVLMRKVMINQFSIHRPNR